MNTINWALASYSGLAGAFAGGLGGLLAVALKRRQAEREQDSPNFYRGLARVE